MRRKRNKPMEITYDDLEMWSQGLSREPFASAYNKAKRLKAKGNDLRIIWMPSNTISVTIKERVKAVRKRTRRVPQK